MRLLTTECCLPDDGPGPAGVKRQGARVISDFRVMGDQRELFGLVASVPTVWRTLKEIACGGARADRRVTAAVNTARRHAWTQAAVRHRALPGGLLVKLLMILAVLVALVH